MRRPRSVTVLVLVAVVGGCDRPPEFVPVEGTVTRAGRPVAKIEVAFYADGDTRGPRVAGVTDDKGRYRLQADTGQAGAVAGQYRVCLYDRSLVPLPPGGMPQNLPPDIAAKLPPELAAKATSAPPKAPVSRVPERYTRPAETPLKAEVRPGSQPLDFQLP